MTLPRSDALPELLDWTPPHGVLSVYLSIDPGDRSGGWITALKDELSPLLETAAAADHELKEAIRTTVKRVHAKFSELGRPPHGRGVVGFVEVDRKEGEERWHTSSVEPRRRALATLASRPHVQPLVELLDDNRPRGVVVVNGERARMFAWEGGDLEEIVDAELLTTGDWRERKAQRPIDTATGQAVSSSGRDQHEQRVEHHRQAFVRGVSRQIEQLSDERGWAELIGFGEAKRLSELEAEISDGKLAYVEDVNLVPEPAHEIAIRLEGLKDGLNRRRELALLEEAEGAAAAGGRGAVGLDETAQALAESRVHHLLVADAALPARPGDDLVEALTLLGARSDLPTAELLIEQALRTDALVTPLEGEPAERLAAAGGAAAILRY